jgi:hypothetical protein
MKIGTIEYNIANGIILSIEQADEVCQDLDHLDATGTWCDDPNGDKNKPVWAKELSEHLRVPKANAAVQQWGWKAAAKAYQRFSHLQIATNQRKK